MDQLAIVNSLKSLIAQQSRAKPDPARIKLTDSFEQDLGIDSLGMLEVVLAVEQDFDLAIPDQDLTLALFDRVENLAQYVMDRLTKGRDETRQGDPT